MIYVDQLQRRESKNHAVQALGAQNDHQWCHLWASDVGKLHAFARTLGLRREWFQDRPGFPHYDLTPGRRLAALRCGAVERDLGEWLRGMDAAKEVVPPSQGEML